MKRAQWWTFVLGLTLLAGAGYATAQTPEERTAHHLDAIRQQPSLLLDFLTRMPKGGDLHNHLSGAVYAESYINFAAHDSLCVDGSTMELLAPPCDAAKGQEAVSNAFGNSALYNSMIDAWSMRNFHPSPGDRSGHDHFFAAFGKFGAVTEAHTGEMVAEVASRAAAQHESYLELMFGPDQGQAARLGKKLGWDDDFGKMRQRLLANGLMDAVAAGRKNLDEDEREMRQTLHCSDVRADAGCGVTVRYLYQVLRGLPKETVFAQILCGFEMARADSRVVGLNLVMPEDNYVPMHDFDLHMRMLDYLHKLYPEVHISLHAGELAPGLVPPDGLSFHIRESVEVGHAERIGHGVDVMQETNPVGLLKEMAERHVLVEICLTSNDLILGVRGAEHPLPVYLLYGVPVALATDDEGVSRSELTWEYLRAAETYKLGYLELKKMVRDSLDHSFLAGASLWEAPEKFRPVAACAGEAFKAQPVSEGCRKFLAASGKAQLEWNEEAEFSRFESGF
ncbi:MAG TPA: adenosine deaminase [Terriglobia bacterium]|nr:adenosine deaminase [Terriglobia bacterium]